MEKSWMNLIPRIHKQDLNETEMLVFLLKTEKCLLYKGANTYSRL